MCFVLLSFYLIKCLRFINFMVEMLEKFPRKPASVNSGYIFHIILFRFIEDEFAESSFHCTNFENWSMICMVENFPWNPFRHFDVVVAYSRPYFHLHAIVGSISRDFLTTHTHPPSTRLYVCLYGWFSRVGDFRLNKLIINHRSYSKKSPPLLRILTYWTDTVSVSSVCLQFQ